MIDLRESIGDTARYPLPHALVHKLRTPLNQIIGYSEMLSEQVQGGVQEAFRVDLEKISVAGQQMLSIIEDNFDAAVVEDIASVAAASIEVSSTPSFAENLGASDAEGSLLVVDDNEGNREVLSRRLEKQGFSVAYAENGRQALEMLAAESYDLVLLDIMMPEIDGFEVLRSMKSDERMQHVPVIMISALSEMESVARCIEMGADDYLTKPYNPVLLKARIGASLQKKRSRDREVQLYEQLQQNFKELQNLEQLRDDLTHMIIHDLRTPLTSMMVALQTMDVVGEMNEGQREVMEIAMTGANILLGMINSLLDVEKMESGGIELDYSLISLPELISSAFDQVLALSTTKGLFLTKEISDNLPWLEADENKIQRTLVNLLGNAIKFTPSGGSVTLEARSHEESKTIEFSVHDSGEGIPAEAFSRIFEKFGQVETRSGGRNMSTGLGLTFCKLAVEAHGGSIQVRSVAGQGSTFSFSVPVSRSKTA